MFGDGVLTFTTVAGTCLHGSPATLTVVEDIKAGARPTMAVLAGQCA